MLGLLSLQWSSPTVLSSYLLYLETSSENDGTRMGNCFVNISCTLSMIASLVSGWRCIFIFLCGGKMLLTFVWLKMYLYLLVWWQDVAHLCLVEDASLSSCVVARCCSLVSGWRCIFIFLCSGKMLLTCVWLKMYLYLLVWWQDVAHLCLVEDVSLSSSVVARCCSLVSGWRCIFIFLCGGKMLLTYV